MSKSQSKKAKREEDVEMEKSISDESSNDDDDESSDKESGPEGEDDGIADDDVDENTEKLNFDFEAIPPDPEDVNQIANLLTQIFLRTDIDFEGLSKEIVSQAPVGCVFRTTEDQADDENEDALYGVSSVVPLTASTNFGIGELLIQRAKKYADKDVAHKIEQLFDKNSQTKIGLIVNERMLHFPAQIAGPALSALKNDIESTKSLKEIDTFILIMKLRFSDEPAKTTATSSAHKPKGKAAKKRALASKLAEADIVYDNVEEELLSQCAAGDFPHFQYPVHFDVEKQSKFHVVRRNGTTYQPFRRVCLLNKQNLFDFCDKAGAAFS